MKNDDAASRDDRQVVPALEMRNASLMSPAYSQDNLTGVNLVLQPGDLVLVMTDHGHDHLPLMDAAEGLLTPSEGNVFFEGVEWRAIGVGITLKHNPVG